jgi:hypothetical protein
MYLTRSLLLPLIVAMIAMLFSVGAMAKTSLESSLAASNATNQQALSLLRELYSIEESIIYPENDQLIFMMAQQYGAQVLLERVDVYIDKKLVISHQLEMGDLEILMNRGIFRLGARLVPPGYHLIDVEIFGFSQVPTTNQFKFNKQSFPQFVSLSLKGNQITLDNWSNE